MNGRSLEYERRLIAFYDILGWTNKISWAGNDAERIAILNRVLSIFYDLSETENRSEIANATTFSDNVVASQRRGVDNEWFLFRIACTQLLAARQDFWVRGGVTVGDILHRENVVFGPGLNRAYEIEKNIAIFPRIVIDGSYINEFGPATDLLSTEEGVTFVDPYSLRFFRKMADISPEFYSTISEPTFGPGYPPEDFGRIELAMIADRVEAELRRTFVAKVAKKLEWLLVHIWRNLHE